jgi:aspartokinase
LWFDGEGFGGCHSMGALLRARTGLAALVSLGVRPEVISSSGITRTILLDKGQVVAAVKKLHADLGPGEPV